MTQIIIDLIAVILTLMVFSRIIGDNPLFRIAQYLFVGVSLGYACVVVYHQVIRIALVQIVRDGDFLLVVPFALGLLLLPRLLGRQQLSWLANIPLGMIFGIGAAIALSGTLVGTLLPQVVDTTRISTRGSMLDIVGSVLLAIGVILVLSYFYFTRPEKAALLRVSEMSAQTGRWLLMVSFGFFLAGALITYLTALSDRLEFLVSWVQNVIERLL